VVLTGYFAPGTGAKYCDQNVSGQGFRDIRDGKTNFLYKLPMFMAQSSSDDSAITQGFPGP